MKSIRSISDLLETIPVNLTDFGLTYSQIYKKPIDIKRLEKEIERNYKETIRKEFKYHSWSEEFKVQEINNRYIKPEIIVLSSPIACQLASLILVDLADHINKEFWLHHIKNLHFLKSEDDWGKIEEFYIKGWEEEFVKLIRSEVSFTIWKEVWQKIKKIMPMYLKTKKSTLGFERIVNVEDLEKKQNLSQEIKSTFASLGIFEVILLQHFCLVSELPIKIVKNAQKQLHSSNSAAMEWSDGFGLFFWNGINIPKEWIMISETITKETLIAEQNIERRRCLMEIMGNERFCELMDFSCIDMAIDDCGNLMKLYRTKLRENTINDFLFYLNVVDPSTKREYMISVPPSYDVHWAKAASFRDKKIQYRHGDVGLLNFDTPFDKPMIES